MLKYEHVSRRATYDPPVYFVGGVAYRVTTTYTDELPDILYYYNHGWHRTDGPAYIDIDDERVWFYVNGCRYVHTKTFCEVSGMSKEETLLWVLRFGDELPMTCEEYYGQNWESIPMDQL